MATGVTTVKNERRAVIVWIVTMIVVFIAFSNHHF